MDLNKLQGLWILSQGLTNEEQVKRAYGVAKARPDLDLCAILLMSNLIPGEAANQARAAALKEAGGGESGEVQETVVGSNRVSGDQLDHSLDTLAPVLGLTSGQTFRQYALESELSRGAMGVVFRARDRDEGRVLALKFMLTNNPDPAELKRFVREAETLVRLKHPNIVEIYDFGSDQDQCFLAMELVGGMDLSEHVKKQLRSGSPGLSVPEALAHLGPIVGALSYCHEQGILHRDLKPQNVLVEPLSGAGARPVLVDFGLMKKMPGKDKGSQSSASSVASLTNAGEIVGTPAFMAPEQFRPDAEFGKMGPWTDVWGWGATLYFLLTGSPPYNKASILEIFQAIVSEDTPRLSQVRDDIPPWLDDLAAQCLQKDSSARPSLDEIQQIIEGTAGESKRSPIPALIVILFLALLLPIGFFLFESPTELTSSLPWPKETAKAKLTFQGRVNNGNTALRIGRIETQSDATGQFKVAVELTQGNNSVALEAFVDGAWVALETRQVYCDTKAPTLELRSEKSKNGFVFIDGERKLQMLIDDKSPPYKIVFDDFQLKTKDPFIEVNQLAQSNPEIVARISDRLGNSRIQQLKVVTDQGLETFRQAISRLESWKAAPTIIQDGVFDWVDRELGEEYEFMGARIYRCGAQSFRIASYLHRKTGVEFQLIPGHKYREIQWSHPKDAYYYVALDVMSRSDSGGKVIVDGIQDSDFGKYRSLSRAYFGINRRDSFDEALEKVKRRPDKITKFREQLATWKSQLQQKKMVKTTVHIIKPMLVGRFELSQKQWNQVVAVGARVKETGANWPMTNVDAILVKKWLKRAGDGFRLPRPFEWRYACAGGSRGPYFWGDDITKAEDYCWVYENSKGKLHSIKEHSRQSNAFGLSDMLGNVGEWGEVSWNNWSRILKKEIEQGRFPKKYSSDLSELEEWSSSLAVMGGRCDWYKSWARADYFYWKSEDDPSSREGFRVFVTVPLDQ